MMRFEYTAGLLAALLLSLPTEAAAAAPDEASAEIVAEQLPFYPLGTCVVSGEELGSMGDPIDFVHEGRLVRFCCSMCEEPFAKDPAKYLTMVDVAVIEAQLEGYPLETCPISGMKLGGMGEPHDHVEGTRLVRFCCEGCLPRFREDPQAAFAKIDAAGQEEAE
jgi:YHS domain-containing protein